MIDVGCRHCSYPVNLVDAWYVKELVDGEYAPHGPFHSECALEFELGIRYREDARQTRSLGGYKSVKVKSR